VREKRARKTGGGGLGIVPRWTQSSSPAKTRQNRRTRDPGIVHRDRRVGGTRGRNAQRASRSDARLGDRGGAGGRGGASHAVGSRGRGVVALVGGGAGAVGGGALSRVCAGNGEGDCGPERRGVATSGGAGQRRLFGWRIALLGVAGSLALAWMAAVAVFQVGRLVAPMGS